METGKHNSIQENIDTFPERGNELEAFISKRPPYFVRWGTVYFFILLVLIATVCRFIPYPERITARGRLNAINAPHSAYIEILIPSYNFGKVKTGQEVIIKFQAYPYEQFGSVTGRIAHINTPPTDSGFLAKVILPKGLHTNYNRSLQYQNGLSAQADIIIKNTSLLERFYANLKKQVSR